jgi:hypothetical protein
MEGGLFAKTETDLPQGGVISPLLSNVYLHELDKWGARRCSLASHVKARRRYAGKGNHRLVQYADDFVIVSNGTITEVQQLKEQLSGFLRDELHLTLSEEKLTAEQLELGATTDLQRAQLFSAKPLSLSGQTMLCLDPTPPPGLEDWQAHAVSLRLPSQETSTDQGGYNDART